MAEEQEEINFDDFLLTPESNFKEETTDEADTTEATGETTEGEAGEGESTEEEESTSGNETETEEEGSEAEKTESGETTEVEETEEDNTDGEEVSVLPLIEAIHEQAGWEFKEDAFKDNDSVEGLMDFVSEVIASNSVPEFASDEVAAFNDFVSKYGADKAGDYLEVNYGQIDYDTIDLENEDNQKRVYAEYLKASTKYSSAKIDKEIKKLVDLDELGDEMEEAKEYLVKDKEAKKVAFEQQQEAAKAAQIESFNNYKATQKTRIENAKDIAGFEPTKEEREDFYKFAYETDRTGKTGYQKYKEQNENLDLELLWHAFKGTNKDKLSKGVKTETAKKLKKSLSRHKDVKAGGGTGTKAPKKANPKKDVNYNDFLL
jgi:hypothetical protein